MAQLEKYISKIEELREHGNLRILRNEIPEDIINLSSNDYLGLQQNKELYEEFLDEISINYYRFTAASSRLLTGNSPEYSTLETLLQSMYNRQAALVFNSGYHANCGILPALAGSQDLIIADKLVHASIIDGMRLGQAQYERFRHLDYEHLEKILVENSGKFDNIFIVTESIFSMDGDRANLPLLVELKKKYNALLYIDEAHAVGVYGATGLGLCEEYNAISDCDFIVGTFGKALASVGAYVICDEIFKTYLINHARTLIYTTALPPINLAWSYFILSQLHAFGTQRQKLAKLSADFAKLLGVEAQSHIVPYIIGSNTDTIACSNNLQEHGFYVLPIRYPTVAKNTARLRFSLQAVHSIDELQHVLPLLPDKKINS